MKAERRLETLTYICQAGAISPIFDFFHVIFRSYLMAESIGPGLHYVVYN